MAPSGYEKTKPNSSIDLSNKQVFLAQVPADFDPRKAEFKSETEIACQGTTYFVNTSASIADCEILTETKDGKLVPSSTKLDGLLALTKKVPLPKVDYDAVTEEKPEVPQVPNLKMRHFPTGYGPKSFGIEDKPVKTSSSSGTRRKHSEKSKEEETPRKKHKKESKSEDGESKKKKKSHKHKSSGKAE